MIFGMDEWTDSDTEIEKENERAKQWISWVAIELNQVAVTINGSMVRHSLYSMF